MVLLRIPFRQRRIAEFPIDHNKKFFKRDPTIVSVKDLFFIFKRNVILNDQCVLHLF